MSKSAPLQGFLIGAPLRFVRLDGGSRLCFAFACLSALLLCLLVRLREGGAVPGNEFYLAGLLYRALPWWRPLALAASAASALLLLSAGRRRGESLSWAALASALLLAGLLLDAPPALCAALLVQVARELDLAARRALSAPLLEARWIDRLGERLAGLRLVDLGLGFVGLSAMSALAVLVLSLGESLLYSRQFASWLFSSQAFAAYQARIVGVSLDSGVEKALLAVGLIALSQVLLRLWLGRAGWPRLAPLAVTVAVAGSYACAMAFLIEDSAGSYLRTTGSTWIIAGVLILLFALWATAIHSGLEALGRARPGGEPPSAMAIWLLVILLPLAPPVSWMPARLRGALSGRDSRLFLYCAAGGGAVLVPAIALIYPELEDFRSYVLRTITMAALHLAGWCLLALAGAAGAAAPTGRRRLPRTAVLGAVVLVAAGAGRSSRPVPADVALIVHEYSRFGAILLRPGQPGPGNGPRLGMSPAPPFPFFGPGERRFSGDELPVVRARRPPIVVVLWDGARWDHMQPYGYRRDTTPHASRLAADGVVFEQAYSMSTATACAVRHLFTGRYSSRYMEDRGHAPFFVHALRRHGYGRFFLTPTPADLNGFSFAAFQRGGPPAASDGAKFFNLTRQAVSHEMKDRNKVLNLLDAWRREVERGGPEALEGSFTFLHLIETHYPWRNGDPVREYGPRKIDQFDEEIAKADHRTGQVLDALREYGLYDEAVIVLLADHGVGLYEHGRLGGFLPYQEQIRIPLIVKAPGLAPRRVREPVGIIDIAPTLQHLFAPGTDNRYHGASLLPLMLGRRERLDRRYLASLCAFEDAYTLLEDGRWKLYYHRDRGYAALFDLARDPWERRSLFDRQPRRVAQMEKSLGAFLWEGRSDYGNPYAFRPWRFQAMPPRPAIPPISAPGR